MFSCSQKIIGDAFLFVCEFLHFIVERNSIFFLFPLAEESLLRLY